MPEFEEVRRRLEAAGEAVGFDRGNVDATGVRVDRDDRHVGVDADDRGGDHDGGIDECAAEPTERATFPPGGSLSRAPVREQVVAVAAEGHRRPSAPPR
jgi:hypothetical protein